MFSIATAGRISSDTAGSPSHPRASEASVIPSWHAERYAFTLLATRRAAFAPLFPSSSAICSCDFLTLTRENSATTKNAFIKRKNTTRTRLSATDTRCLLLFKTLTYIKFVYYFTIFHLPVHLYFAKRAADLQKYLLYLLS